MSARWTHNGEKMSLLFPLSWLSRAAVEFYGMKIHVVAPELQYILKERPESLNPGWRMRETDKIEQEHLQVILTGKGPEICPLHKLVKSME